MIIPGGARPGHAGAGCAPNRPTVAGMSTATEEHSAASGDERRPETGSRRERPLNDRKSRFPYLPATSPGDGATLTSTVRVSPVKPAVAPIAPTSPRPALNGALGLFLGLAGGLVLALLIETADRQIHGPGKADGAAYLLALGALLGVGLWAVGRALRLLGRDARR